MEFQFKEKYNIDDLVEIVKILRSPDGCPWDKEQSHSSIRRDFIEEVYEAVEAIDTGDTELLKEELGDVLLQVVFHSQIEREKENFTLDDVADGVCKKMIIRHPHVFGEVKADTTEAVIANWDNIKMQTKSQTTQTETLQSISKALPSLIRSEKIQKKADKCGFKSDNINGALCDCKSNLSNIKSAIENNNKNEYEKQIGDLLFSVVNISRLIGIDSEAALYNACERFIDNFAELEVLIRERNIDIKGISAGEINSLWQEVEKK